MLLLYNDKLVKLGWKAGGQKIGFPWHIIYPISEDLEEKIQGINSNFAINLNKFKSIFEEQNTKLFPVIMNHLF